jgi:hypothetical protein
MMKVKVESQTSKKSFHRFYVTYNQFKEKEKKKLKGFK